MGLKVNTRGFLDWIVQRATAVIIGAYAIFLCLFLVCHAPLTYVDWSGLFSNVLMRIATVIVMLAILWHAWIGLWTVFTDYVKCAYLRLVLQVGVIVLLVGYLVWCLDAFW